ncbi:MAG: alkaline phosphatase family protein [Candidatus Nanohalobium sp.]
MAERIFPKYGEASLAEVPGTAMKLLDIETDLPTFSDKIIDTEKSYENVVLILVDGLRYDRAENTEGFFRKARKNGNLEKATSVFPSATPATLTTLNTGRRPLGHGLLGWHMYYSEIKDHIFTLPFSLEDGGDPAEEGLNPEKLFEGDSFYRDFPKEVEVFTLVKRDIMDSEYTELTSTGAEKISYSNTADMALKLRNCLERDGKKFVYGYTADVDSVSHIEGPETEALQNQVEMISDTLEKNLVEELDEEDAEDTLLMITSDHGQIEGGERIDLLKWDKVPECVEKDENGDPVGPSGNAGRSVFLRVEDGKVDELQEFLQEKIDAEVLKTEEAVEKGLFGEGLEAERFRDRAGDLTIISHGRKIHWFRPETLEDKGFHGGLHEKEMEIPLLYCELSELQG